MVKIFDRYIVRQILLPFFLALLVLTFMLLMPPILLQGRQLIEKGFTAGTVARVLITLTPQALSVTIPMALLYGVLIGLGRLSADREFVALQACGVSIFRALRPIVLLAVVAFAADEYVLLVALPDANQSFREITFNVVAGKAESDVKPRTFFTSFPNRVLYVRDVLGEGGWTDVFLADTTRMDQTTVYFASRGHLLVDRTHHTVQVLLENGTQHTTFTMRPEEYEGSAFDRLMLNMDAETVFPRTQLIKGDNEMTIAELKQVIADHKANGLTYASQLFTIQQKFSIPISCLVLAAVGLALGASNRKEGTLASFAVGSGVIFAYYVILYSSRAAAMGGGLSPVLAPWIVNIVLGFAGLVLMVWRAGSADDSIRITLPRFGRAQVEQPVGAAATPRQVVVVIRIPRLHWPRPKLLDVYISRRYLEIFGLAFGSLIGIFYISTFIDLADKLFRGTTTTAVLARFFFFQTPQYVYYIIPLAALVATLVTVGVLTKNSEIVVMRACGISLYRSAVPLMIFAAAFSVALFELEERVLPFTNREAKTLEAEIRQRPIQVAVTAATRRWMIANSGDIYHYDFFDSRSDKFNNLMIFHREPSTWRLDRLIYARNVGFVGGSWSASGGWEREFVTAAPARKPGKRAIETAVDYRPFAARSLPLESPEFFKTEDPDPDRMTYGELRDYIVQLQSTGYYAIPYLVQLQRKVAFPFVTVIVTLLAVPFAATTGRSGAMYGIGIGIALAIVYWTALTLFGALGSAGVMSPMLAAWAPNILFGAAAVYMLLTVRT